MDLISGMFSGTGIRESNIIFRKYTYLCEFFNTALRDTTRNIPFYFHSDTSYYIHPFIGDTLNKIEEMISSKKPLTWNDFFYRNIHPYDEMYSKENREYYECRSNYIDSHIPSCSGFGSSDQHEDMKRFKRVVESMFDEEEIQVEEFCDISNEYNGYIKITLPFDKYNIDYSCGFFIFIEII